VAVEFEHAVLSESLHQRLRDRRLISGVFLTFRFDPGFFEQEVLPVLLDAPVSHAAVIRLVQLEDALRAVPGPIAVYYDANGLVCDTGAAKLDVRRIPVRHRTGVFHPKNAFLLVESAEPDDSGHRARTLLVATLSANLTRAGWWENVEVCHLDEIAEAERSRLRADLVAFLEGLRRKVAVHPDPLRDVLGFLRATDPPGRRRSETTERAQFFAGRETLPDFLERAAGERLVGTNLEILSPYFDDDDLGRPLRALVERFRPKAVRLLLPRSAAGEALCREGLYEAVRSMPGVSWGHLPKDFLRMGRSEDVRLRAVHAKVYRFFVPSARRETYFVGSVNLTTPAHGLRGNVETGCLVDVARPRRPDWWLVPDEHRPTGFRPRVEADVHEAPRGTRLRLRYEWDRSRATALWDDSRPSPCLTLEARGVPVGSIGPLPAQTWVELPSDLATRLAELLAETSFLFVLGDRREAALLLVQEDGMSHKPSLLLSLSAADILRYWSLLTPAQRAAFLEARAPDLALAGPGADLVARAAIAREEDTLFDRFAGFFHAFACLERSVRAALDAGGDREAVYRLFGCKYDSLGNLLDRVAAGDGAGDDVDRYVILLCARQLLREVERRYPEFWGGHCDDVSRVARRFETADEIRARLSAADPERMPGFLDWFEPWFLLRAQTLTEAGA